MKKIIIRSLTALGVLMLSSAIFHIIFIWLMFFIKKDLVILNPLYLYGLNIVFPEAAASAAVSVVGWGVLCLLFFVVAVFFHYFRINIRVTSRSHKRSSPSNHPQIESYTIAEESASI